jgi:hypothetical protein
LPILDGFDTPRGSEFSRGGETAFQPNWKICLRPFDGANDGVNAGAYAGAFTGVNTGADRPGWGCFFGVFFQQTKALMKSVLCSEAGAQHQSHNKPCRAGGERSSAVGRISYPPRKAGASSIQSALISGQKILPALPKVWRNSRHAETGAIAKQAKKPVTL